MMVKTFHRRLAELYDKHENKTLTLSESVELYQCIQLNRDWIVSIQKLELLSFASHIVNDLEAQFEVCARMEILLNDPHLTKV